MCSELKNALWQVAGFSSAGSACRDADARFGIGEVQFIDQVLPGVKKVVYGVDIKRVFRGKLILGVADGWLEGDGRRIYEVKDIRVGLFSPSNAGLA